MSDERNSATSDDSLQANPFDRLADEFVARYRRGERPALTEYCARHPELSDDIRRVFPTLVMMEQARPGESDTGTAPCTNGGVTRLERLGDYRILREVARGGMGIVYEAEQESLGRHVALKILPPQAVLDPRHLQRFQREARAAARLHHTNIVPVFGVGESDGLYYYVMQFINGLGIDQVLNELRRLRYESGGDKPQSLTVVSRTDRRRAAGADATQPDISAEKIAESLISGQFHASNQTDRHAPSDATSAPGASRVPETDSAVFRVRPPSPDGSGSGISLLARDTTSLSRAGLQYWQSVARLGVQVAEAIDYAFGQGVLHRDIKPSNLLLDTHGTVWVTDFGLAKSADSDDLTHTGDIVGTLRYLAPERLRGELDLRSDIYSLGVTLYEMVTLRSPFETSDRGRLLRQIAHEEPPRPSDIDRGIPRDLETIVLKAIAKDPSDRYQKAGELAADLRRFLEDRPIAARRAGPIERFWRSCRRNPVVASLTTAVVALLFSAVIILSISNARIRRETFEKELALKSAREKEIIAVAAATERDEQRRNAETNALIAQRRFYAAQMQLASQALERGQLARVLDLLESQRPHGNEPDLRGFEWFYLWNKIHQALHVSFRHDDEVWRLAFSPDGSTLAVGGKSGDRGSLRLWDVSTGQLQAQLSDDEDVVHGLEFSPDGKFLASGSADARIRIWDVAARRVTNRIKTKSGVRSLRWSRDANLIVAGLQDGAVRIYDSRSFELKASLESLGAPVLGLAISADGKRLISAVAWGGPERMFSRIYDLTTAPPQPVQDDLHGRFITDLTPDASKVASYERGVLSVWDPAGATNRMQITTSAGWLNSLRFSPDTRRVATAGFDDRVATVWDCETGRPLVRGPHAQAVQVVAFDPNQRFWASASIDGEVKIWHYDEPVPPTSDEPRYYKAVAALTDGSLVLGGDSMSVIRDIESGEERPIPDVRHLRAISADGRTLVAAVPADDKHSPETIEIWDRATGERRAAFRLPDDKPLYYRNIAISPSGRLLATRSEDCPLRIWDVSGSVQLPVCEFEQVMSMCVTFSPDERLVAAGCQAGRVKLFDVESRTALPDLLGYESGSGWAFSVAFSPDSKRLAAGNNFGVVRVWDVRTPQLIATLEGHPGEIPNLLFFPDGRRLAVASVGLIQLWDAELGQELIALDCDSDVVRYLAVTPDGNQLVSQDDGGRLRIWNSRSRRTIP